MRQHMIWGAQAEFPYALNLSEGFTPVTKSIPLKFKKFDFLGGEPHFQILDCTYISRVIITQRYNKIGDLFDILMAVDALRRLGFKNIELVLPYFPAARQDRVCNEGEPLTIRLFTDLINGCGFDQVTILCPHSEVTPALLNNVTVLDEISFVYKAVFEQCYDAKEINIVCPDAGAGKRVGKIVKELSAMFADKTFHLIRCEKVRDVVDGKLKGFYVQADDLGGFPTIIVDDIVAMGGTFCGLGEELKKKNAGDLMLFTAHADCTEGLYKMTQYFNQVFTTNSKKNWTEALVLDEYTPTGNFTCYNILL